MARTAITASGDHRGGATVIAHSGSAAGYRLLSTQFQNHFHPGQRGVARHRLADPCLLKPGAPIGPLCRLVAVSYPQLDALDAAGPCPTHDGPHQRRGDITAPPAGKVKGTTPRCPVRLPPLIPEQLPPAGRYRRLRWLPPGSYRSWTTSAARTAPHLRRDAGRAATGGQGRIRLQV